MLMQGQLRTETQRLLPTYTQTTSPSAVSALLIAKPRQLAAGHDFRPAYMHLAKLRDDFPGVPFIALVRSLARAPAPMYGLPFHCRHQVVIRLTTLVEHAR